MIGFLAYLPTVAFVPHLLFVFVLVYLILKKGPNLNIGKLRNIGLLVIIITLSIANNLYHTENIKEFTDYIPFVLLVLISYIAALNFTKTDAKVLVILISIEALVCMAESYMGVSSFFTSLENYRSFNGSNLLYFNRTLGLSENSSATALKFLVGILITHHYNLLESKFFKYCLALIFVGIILTFNRTVLVVLIFFYGIYFIQNIFKAKITHIQSIALFTGMTVLSVLMMFYADDIFEKVVGQFTRNTGSVELSGRTQVWYLFGEYIQQNFMLGNGSYKYMLDTYIRGRVFHAHNSFLQIFATHGAIISAFYILLILINLNSKNILLVSTIILYSLSQYGIFWGVSLLDIIFFLFLFFPNNINTLQASTNIKHNGK